MSNDFITHVDDDALMEHYLSPRQKRSEPAPNGQPPLTPMIDVTFQLLLYFLLTSTFQEDEGQIPGTLPALGKGGTPSPLKPVTIKITADPFNMSAGATTEKYYFQIENQGREFDKFPAGFSEEDREKGSKRLQKELKDIFSKLDETQKKKISLKIEPSQYTRWSYATEAFNQAVAAGFTKIAFANPS